MRSLWLKSVIWRLLLLVFCLAGGIVISQTYSPAEPREKTSAPVPKKPAGQAMREDITQGALRVSAGDRVVECPLKHTDVKIAIAGFIACATVVQTFYNPYDTAIEATYVFPLPHGSAVDSMTMVIGDRRIVGVMKRRAEARATYQKAISAGKTASLLEQERPNIFTQTVGNIPPQQEVRIEISYVDTLEYDMGVYEMHFPMVVGPRYIPGAPISKTPPVTDNNTGVTHTMPGPTSGPSASGTGWSPDTDRVTDASRITPPVLKPGFRSGHDINLSVALDAGVPVHEIKSVNHQAVLTRRDAAQADLTLDPADAIPNKDFVLRYAVAGEKPEMALISHAAVSNDGYFMLMVQPRLEEELPPAPPRELVFLIDVSGSMSGEPTEKNKAIMREFFKQSKRNDTFQVITFESDARKIFPRPVPVTRKNTAKALRFTEGLQGNGGTEMMKGVEMALDEPVDPSRVRIIVMMTDGFIGNESEIVKAVKEKTGDQVRFWALGIGSSPNRYLIDGVAKAGEGMSAVVELGTDPTDIVQNIVERIHRAQIAQLSIDWNGLQVKETYPQKLPELWAGRPVIVYGRYTEGGQRRITLRGRCEGEPVSYALDVDLPLVNTEHDVLAKVWARKKIDDLSMKMLENNAGKIEEEITQIALQYRLMTKYTSFVAVDETTPATKPAGPPKKVTVPVDMPEGVSHTGVFGAENMVASNTPYIGGGGGDPWIRVAAPPDARRVVAVFPDGGVKELTYNRQAKHWVTRFDFPFGTAAGDYRVTVIVVRKDGTRITYHLKYVNLLSCAVSAKAAGLQAIAGKPVTVHVTGSGIQRAVVVTPWGERCTMTSQETAWRGDVTVPAHWPAGKTALTAVLFDGAHNRTEITIDLAVK